jgi:hypothetical protein
MAVRVQENGTHSHSQFFFQEFEALGSIAPQFHQNLPKTEPQILLIVFKWEQIFSNLNIVKPKISSRNM